MPMKDRKRPEVVRKRPERAPETRHARPDRRPVPGHAPQRALQARVAEKRPERRALTNVGGDITVMGEEIACEGLAHALSVMSSLEDEESPRDHMHGFHSYPARIHPVTAARLVTAFSKSGATVLDPFAGSGTVLLEANIAGRSALGVDLNPLAVELAREKLRPLGAHGDEALLQAAHIVTEFAEERRLARAGATRRLPQEDVAVFAPHTLLELDSLRGGILTKAAPSTRWPLLLVLSSILTKMSQKRGDSSEMASAKRIAAGYPSKLFLKKTAELVDRKQAFEQIRTKAPARMIMDDATKLEHIKPESVDLVVSSPPYVATYDYVQHHAMRMRWLGLKPDRFTQDELGPRRGYANLSSREAETKWLHELRGFFRALVPTLRKGAKVALVIADSAAGQTALRADVLVPRAAADAKLAWIATASQERPHFHMYTARVFEKEARREHVILFGKA
jgi:hypothetical protein